MDTLAHLGEILAWCWNNLFQYEFNVSGIKFTLANVAEATVIIWAVAYCIEVGLSLQDSDL